MFQKKTPTKLRLQPGQNMHYKKINAMKIQRKKMEVLPLKWKIWTRPRKVKSGNTLSFNPQDSSRSKAPTYILLTGYILPGVWGALPQHRNQMTPAQHLGQTRWQWASPLSCNTENPQHTRQGGSSARQGCFNPLTKPWEPGWKNSLHSLGFPPARVLSREMSCHLLWFPFGITSWFTYMGIRVK